MNRSAAEPRAPAGSPRPRPDPAPWLSVVIPAYNEEPNAEACYRELREVLAGLGRPYEIIFVDDGSTDGTFRVLAGLAEADARLRVIRFRRNAGQTAALAAGFRAARGDLVVTMDADLQNDPRDIPLLLERLAGHDAVCGWRVRRQDPWAKRVGSRVANSVRRRLTGDGVHDTGCMLKAFRRAALDRLTLYRGMHRFLPALLRLEGCRVTEVAVRHRPRRAGQSKYGNWSRLWGGLADLWAVRWMARRRLDYEIAEERGAGGPG
ncbi:MAG: glycosyltransferase family 2 protein [Candidatus Rokubacteria bacterium]|nr:glycosyltransferase family 2 protein [Candidatus Rokubacteria bacterium]